VAATTSGLTMLPLMLGMIGTSAIAGRIVSRTGKYKPVMLAGSSLLLVALFALSRVNGQSTVFDIGWRVLLLGVGLGPSMSLYNIAVQNAVERTQIGVATSATQFFRQIGGTVGVAVFGAVLTQSLSAATMASGAPIDFAEIQRLAAEHLLLPSAPVHPEVREATVGAIRAVFLVATGVAALALFLVTLIPALPMEGRETKAQ
jgi:MFS family permease